MKPKNDNSPQALKTTSSLEDLQSAEQRKVLNIVDQLRQCDLESTLFLPQLVVCDDQSVGKSSVLEALTEIPFPRNDNLCTRFATEIILRRVTSDVITIKVISDNERPPEERAFIESFKEFISDFEELSSLMNKATTLMKINNKSTSKFRIFAKDVLSIEIEGRSRSQLTLIDLSGLVQTETRGVIEENVQLVIEIIDHYIFQPRTICLAVVSTINDYVNQDILKKVRKVDPEEDRTLDIITKLDRLSFGSGSESAFLGLIRNEDIFFKLGWHVLKNRSYEEGSSSFEQRNISEINYFRRSKFFTLSKECVGITSLRDRLSQLLFDHVKQKLSKLRKNLEKVFTNTQLLLKTMGNSRATPQKCKAFLTQLSLNFYEIGKAAVNEHYEEEYFAHSVNHAFSVESSSTIRRLRAVIRYKNCEFFDLLRTHDYKYHISEHEEAKTDGKAVKIDVVPIISTTESVPSIHWFKSRAMN
jgi:GTPase SAR1 family protein